MSSGATDVSQVPCVVCKKPRRIEDCLVRREPHGVEVIVHGCEDVQPPQLRLNKAPTRSTETGLTAWGERSRLEREKYRDELADDDTPSWERSIK